MGDAIGMDRVGIHFSPNIYSQGVEDSDPAAVFTALAQRLEELKVPWIELRRRTSRPRRRDSDRTGQPGDALDLFRQDPAQQRYDGASARERMAEGIADGISFGRPFISKPDLVHRLAVGAKLSPGDQDIFYSGGAAGYVDYPTVERSEGCLGRVFFAEFQQRERRPRRVAALVALLRVGADDRLLLILDGQDAVADRKASSVRAMRPRALSSATISK